MAYSETPSLPFLCGRSRAGGLVGGRRVRSLLAVVAVLAVFVGGMALDSSSALAKVKRDGDPPFEIEDLARSGFLLDSVMPERCAQQGWDAQGALSAIRTVGSAEVCFGVLWDPRNPGDLSLLFGTPGFSGKFWNIYSEGRYFVLMFDIDNDPKDNIAAVRHVCISFSPSWRGWEDCVFVRYDGQKLNQQQRVYEHSFSFAEAEIQAGGTVANFSYLVLDDLADYVFGLAGRMPIVFAPYNNYQMTSDHSYFMPENAGLTEVKKWCSRTYTYRGGAYLAPFAYEMCLTPAVDTGYGTPGRSGSLKVGISPALKKVLENNPSPIDHEITMNYAFILRNGSHISRSSIIRCGSIVPAGDGHVFECDTRTSIYADDSTLPKDEIIGIRMRNFTTDPPQPPGARVVALEVTQGLQDWSNNLTLVKDRRTVVRAFIQTDRGSQRMVTATLHRKRISGDPFEPSSEPPVNSDGYVIAQANVSDRRGDINSSLNFVLPNEWTKLETGEHLSLKLVFDDTSINCNEGLNFGFPANKCAEQVTFTEVFAPKIVIVPISIMTAEGLPSVPSVSASIEQMRWIRSALPLPREGYFMQYGFNNNEPLEYGTHLSEISRQMQYDEDFDFDDGNREVLYLGVLKGNNQDNNNDEDDGSAYSGYEGGRVGSWYIGEIDGLSSETSAHFGHDRNAGAHELGHLLGIHHPGWIVEHNMQLYGMCEESDVFEDPDNPDSLRLHDPILMIRDYSKINEPTDQEFPRPGLGPLGNIFEEVWGVDTRYVGRDRYGLDANETIAGVLSVIDPHLVFSLMSYCWSVVESEAHDGKGWFVVCRKRDGIPDTYIPQCDSHRGGQGQWLDASRHEYLVDCLSSRRGCLSEKPNVDVIVSGEVSPAMDSDLIVGSVLLSSDDAAEDIVFDPLFSRPRQVKTPFAGEYSLELRDASDDVVRSVPFSVLRSTDSDSESEAGFSVVVPSEPDYASFAVVKQQEELAVVRRSENAPAVSISGISGGQVFGSEDSIDLSWQGTDADGDELSYRLYYSTDGGDSYRVLSSSTKDTAGSYSTDWLEGSEQSRIGISVSDGTRSSFSQSPVFSVAGHLPEVWIETPLPGAVFAGHRGFLLDADGYDVEDGSLPSSAFRWHSSIDGDLGAGEFLVLSTRDLTPGDHTITVIATDSDLMSADDSVDITISFTNSLPAANDDTAPAAPRGGVLIDVLANDIDIEGDIDFSTLTIASQPQSGTAEVSYTPLGLPVIEYSPTTGGPDSFTYFICDGLDRCDSAQVTVGFPDCTITGTDGDDILTGTPGDDVICALGGNDTIDGRDGNDFILAGSGDDTVYGRAGDDTIFGAEGDDFILGHRGKDIIHAGAGDDIVYAGGGNDTIYGEQGADELYGEADNDTIYGSYGADIIHGGRGDDTIWGEDGEDTIRGNAGKDTIYPGTGTDTILGTAPEDTVTEP